MRSTWPTSWPDPLAETSYYRAQTTYCRDRFLAGDFGSFVYGEGQYHHDMAHFYRSYMRSNGERWKQFASFPPMLYPTHSVAFILGVTFRRMTEVSCFGYVDDDPDGIFDADLSHWSNVFSNETGLFRTSDGGMARICEFRRTAHSMMERTFSWSTTSSAPWPATGCRRTTSGSRHATTPRASWRMSRPVGTANA